MVNIMAQLELENLEAVRGRDTTPAHTVVFLAERSDGFLVLSERHGYATPGDF